MELIDPNEKPAMPIFPAGTPCARTQSQPPRTSMYSSLPPANRASSPWESPWSRRSMRKTEKPARWSMPAARSTAGSRRHDCTPCTRIDGRSLRVGAGDPPAGQLRVGDLRIPRLERDVLRGRHLVLGHLVLREGRRDREAGRGVVGVLRPAGLRRLADLVVHEERGGSIEQDREDGDHRQPRQHPLPAGRTGLTRGHGDLPLDPVTAGPREPAPRSDRPPVLSVLTPHAVRCCR